MDRPLIAGSKRAAAGHQGWFGKEHGTITNGTTGKTTHVEKRNGVYTMTIWVPRPTPAKKPPRSGGSRQCTLT